MTACWWYMLAWPYLSPVTSCMRLIKHSMSMPSEVKISCSNVKVSAPSSNGSSHRCQGRLCNAAFAPLDVAEQVADKVAEE